MCKVLENRRGPILQGSVCSLGTLGFVLCAKEAVKDYDRRRNVIQLCF